MVFDEPDRPRATIQSFHKDEQSLIGKKKNRFTKTPRSEFGYVDTSHEQKRAKKEFNFGGAGTRTAILLVSLRL